MEKIILDKRKNRSNGRATQKRNKSILTRIRNQSSRNSDSNCKKKEASVFRQLASRFNSQAKEIVDVAGRTNKIPFEILQED
jgi:hypothetical protein